MNRKLISTLFILLPLISCQTGSNEFRYPIIKNGKYGFINESGNVMIKPSFDHAWEFYDGFANVRINNKWGFIDEDGKYIIEPIYQMTSYKFFNKNIVAQKDDKYGILDSKGEKLISFTYNSLSLFYDGLSAVEFNGKWGYMNEEESLIIKQQYDFVDIFKNGYAVCFKDDYSYLINKKGERLLTYKYPQMIEYFEEGILVILEFAHGGPVYIQGEDKPRRKLERHYWFVDTTGKRLNDKIYFYINPFSEGFAYVSEEYGKFYFMNKKGEEVFDANSYTILGESYFKNGYAPIKGSSDLSIGYINTEGKIVIPPIYGKHIEIPAKPFSEGLVAILDTTPNKEQVNLYGYMNDKADWVIKPQFYRAYDFKNGLAKVYIDDKHEWSYVNKQGKIVWKSEDLRKGEIIGENTEPISYRELRGWYGKK